MRRRALRAAAVAAVVATLLSGCVSWFIPTVPGGGDKTSSPAPADVPPELQPYYTQVLRWEDCGGGFQCATATAPMDWANPGGEDIELALVRSRAKGQRIGSLLVNPGGPGASGYGMVRDSLDFATTDALQQRFDIVGFDPRGVGRSSAIACYGDDPASLDEWNYGILPGEKGSEEWLAEGEKAFADFGADCARYSGDLIDFVDTRSAARDMDLLRGILGDAKLNYLGYSYGTALGATYAELFPQNVGRLVLDGAIDPTVPDFEVTKAQAVGFEGALRAYLASCLNRSDCPFSGTVDGAERTIRRLLDQLAAHPLSHSDGRQLGELTMFYAIILPLYSPDSWAYLSQLFTEVMAGGTDTAFLLADIYNDRNDDGSYASNQTEAFIAINCSDYRTEPVSYAELTAQAAELAAAAPVFGPAMSWGTGCVGWPFQATREHEPQHAAGAAPILVLGTTNDPATPYQWAVGLAGQLESGHLVTYHGEGHTAFNKGSSCVDDAVESYFVDGTVPASDPDCD